jgi:hypothetical protein
MGMYDKVNVNINCPKCGNPIKEFQTKDHNNTLGTVDPTEVDCFYSDCSCGNWIDFVREVKPFKIARKEPFTLGEVEELGFEMKSKL